MLTPTLSDEVIRVEQFKIKNFLRLGATIYTATLLVELGVDWHDVENVMDKGADFTEAVKIVR